MNNNNLLNQKLTDNKGITYKSEWEKICNKINGTDIFESETDTYDKNFNKINNMIHDTTFSVLFFNKTDYYLLAVLFMVLAGNCVKRTTKSFNPETTYILANKKTQEWTNPSEETNISIVVRSTIIHFLELIQPIIVLGDVSLIESSYKRINQIISNVSNNSNINKITQHVIKFTYDPNFKSAQPNSKIENSTELNKSSSTSDSEKEDNYKQVVRDFVDLFCILGIEQKIESKIITDKISNYSKDVKYKCSKYSSVGPKRSKKFLLKEYNIKYNKNTRRFEGITLKQLPVNKSKIPTLVFKIVNENIDEKKVLITIWKNKSR